VRSYACDIPLGPRINRVPLVPKNPTSASPPVLVDTPGAVIDLLRGVYRPLCASTGLVVSTPEKEMIAPAAAAGAENCQRAEEGSELAATL